MPLEARVEYVAPVRTTQRGQQGYMFLVADSSGTLMVQAYDKIGEEVYKMLKVPTHCHYDTGTIQRK